MTKVKNIFGLPEQDIQSNCIIVPFLNKAMRQAFGIQKSLKAGRLFSAVNISGATLVLTRMGPGFVGDAVMFLDETPAQKLFLLGSCGIIKKTRKYDLGSLLVPKLSYAYDSFCALMQKKKTPPPAFRADPGLLQRIRASNTFVQTVVGAAFVSLAFEERFQADFLAQGITSLDMESAVFYAAAQHIQRKACALLFTTDILTSHPFMQKITSQQELVIQQAAAQAANTLQAVCQSL